MTQINDGNVGGLGLAWYADLPDARGQESTPIVIDGTIYVTGPWSKLFAYDVLSGKKLWEFDPGVDKSKGVEACCDVVNRGVAAWKGKLYLGTIDGRLIAIDAASGRQVWSVQTTDNSKPYTITGAPRVVKGMVIIGNGGAEFGVRGLSLPMTPIPAPSAERSTPCPMPISAPMARRPTRCLAKAANRPGRRTASGSNRAAAARSWDSIVYDPETRPALSRRRQWQPMEPRPAAEGQGDNLFLLVDRRAKPDTGEYLALSGDAGRKLDFTATQPIILAISTWAARRARC